MVTNLIQLKPVSKLLFVSLAFLAASTITSCKKSEKPSLYANADVYVAGTVFGDNKATTATIWKNGVATALTDKTVTSYATSVAVSNGDVYVSGTINYNAVYWKNGVVHNLTTGPDGSNATGIAIIGSDVWVIGTTTSLNSFFTIPVYWKNDVIQNLVVNPLISIYPTSIGTDGNNILITGWGSDERADMNTESLYWENETTLNHLDSLSKYSNSATCLAVSNGSVYIGGISVDTSNLTRHYLKAILWKNGVKTVLDNNSEDSEALGAAVAGSDVYIAGNINDRSASYWKNGNLTILATGTGALPCTANAIAINGNDVYVVGRSGLAIGFWKNGAITILTSNGLGSGIVVIPHNQ